jgi:tetratricopeptide (TPR) repeat protein
MYYNNHADRSAFYFHLANIYGKTDQFELAESHYLKALSIDPKNDLYYANTGVLYHRWKKTSKAKEYYIKALKINPEHQSALRNLKSLTSK